MSIQKAEKWFVSKKWKVFPFQKKAWHAFLDGKSGIVNAPTGSGKTYSVLIPALLEGLATREKTGLQLIWISPIRALTKEIKLSCERAIEGLGLDWDVGIRSGDSTTSERNKQWSKPPQILITTPESMHVLMTKKKYSHYFRKVKSIVVDEWHELIGSKRGVQTELLISRLRGICPNIKIWGISATIGNMEEAIDVLLGVEKPKDHVFIKSKIKKKIIAHTIMPDVIEKFPWSGHIGLKMIEKVIPIIKKSKATLIFTNTRALCEIWYQNLLILYPDFAGQIAVHHGSLSRDVRDWVEDALYNGNVKAVVCTSSLDLGVDFRPVETIIQIGSPKGVARFLQRAGRSGHQPGAKSKIYFVPTHSIELIEAAALKTAIEGDILEQRVPYIRSFDVLIQYLMTLAVSEGFHPETIYQELLKTFSYSSVSREEWQFLLHYLEHGSQSLQAYDEYEKVVVVDGLYIVENKRIALRHKLSIGTIVSSGMMQIKLGRGTRIGSVEEWFISQMNIGDAFWFSGKALDLVRVKDMVAQVKISKKKKAKIPSYQGGRMPLSSEMSVVLRKKLYDYKKGIINDKEISTLIPLFETQEERSILPGEGEFLIEYFESEDGYHLMMYPFEGRNVHQGIGALLANRIGSMMPISFTIGMNDYGFELLSDKKIDVENVVTKALFSTKKLAEDIQSSINAVELARRRFREIAKISGLIFAGYPGKRKKDRHLQASSQLLFNVFREYEPDNLLHLQAYDEVMTFQLEEFRMREALKRIQKQIFTYSYPVKAPPFAFPIMVDRLRERMSSEKLEDRIEKMKSQLFK